MSERTITEPYESQSLLELIDPEVLSLLRAGYSDKLQMGIKIFCKDTEGKLTLFEEDKNEVNRFWSDLCKTFRKNKDCDRKCQIFDEKIAEEFLQQSAPKRRAHACEPLCCIDMALQIRVNSKPLGVIIAGQRVPSDKEGQERIRSQITAEYSERGAELKEAFEKDIQVSDYSYVCSAEEIEELLDGLEQLAEIVSKVCQDAYDRRVEINQRKFFENWMNELAESGAQNMTRWQSKIKDCFQGLCQFVDPIERVGLFHGSIGEKAEAISYSLFAMNSARWWASKKFSCTTSSTNSLSYYGSCKMPEEMVPAVGDNLAKKKSFYVYPFSTKNAPEQYGEVFSIILIQTRGKMEENLEKFCEEFCSSLCRRDAITRLFQHHIRIHKEFERNVRDIRHDLNMGMQYVVSNIDRLVRELRYGTSLDSKEGKSNWDKLKKSVELQKQNVRTLRPPELAGVSHLEESVDVFRKKLGTATY